MYIYIYVFIDIYIYIYIYIYILSHRIKITCSFILDAIIRYTFLYILSQ